MSFWMKRRSMNPKYGVITGIAVALGVGIGGTLMYWFDPSVGSRRRRNARYQARRVVRQLDRSIDRTSREFAKLSRIDLLEAARNLVPARARALIGS
jgi:hypothetical protein